MERGGPTKLPNPLVREDVYVAFLTKLASF